MNKKESLLLLAVVVIIAGCGLIYELLAGTVASYLLGDSVTQFSMVIGTYLFSMGIGAYLSKFVKTEQLLDQFIWIEFMVGLVGGISATILLLLFPVVAGFHILLYFFVVMTGVLVGLEIPLLLRILKDSLGFEQLISRVFTFDYMGALFASIVFPLVFVPYLGLSKTALFFGILNICTGIVTVYMFQQKLNAPLRLKAVGYVSLILLMVLMIYAERIMSIQEGNQYPGKVIYSAQSNYQRIVVTRDKQDFKLFLNNNLQFSSDDEYRYHEALVHPLMQGAKSVGSILVLGGGDGMAVREILKYPEVKHIVLVDLDTKVTTLFRSHPAMLKLNNHSMLNQKVRVINEDAFVWLRNHKETFDAAVIDFPDPSNYAIGKLYTNTFYNELKKHLMPGASCVIQCTSPYVAKNAFWCIDTTLRSAGFNTIPYYNNVPSFGIWGYIIATTEPMYTLRRPLPPQLKFYKSELFASMRNFSLDMQKDMPINVNRLNNQFLVTMFEKEWSHYQ